MDLTVVIAARNAASTLPAQLDALDRQRADLDWEVLVADNGSTDGTRDLVRDRPGLRLIDAADFPGAGHARNLGALAARGRWLAFCDADDVVADDWVTRIAAALSAAPLVAGRLDWDLLNDDDARRSRALPQVTGLQSTAPLSWLHHASASNLAVHADLFHALGGFDVGARFLQDTDLCWRAQLSGVALRFDPEVVVHMRLRTGLRGAWRQGRNTGMGQRWLMTRYGHLTAPDDPATRAPRTDPTEPRAATALPHAVTRVLRRVALVGGRAGRIRTRGDLAALCWDTGFGLGFARGGLPDPAPFSRPELHARSV